ncbi:hypothetical protein GCM10023212_27190 [Luteolibacter yonseiensis]
MILDRKNEENLWKVVSRLPAAEIPEALRILREARAITASRTMEENRLDEIESALYYRWAESDPAAAQADVAAMPGAPDEQAGAKRNKLMKSVLNAWMKTDPDAAYRSVKDQYYFSHMGRDMLVKTWTAQNVFENLKRFPDKEKDLFASYCAEAAKREDSRNAMLKALKERPDIPDRDRGYGLLFREWTRTDLPAAMAEAKNVDLPGFEKIVLENGIQMQPAAALRWAAGKNIPPDGRTWWEGYSSWISSDTADAEQWLEKQAPVWEEAGHFEAVAMLRIQQLSKQDKIDLKTEQPIWTALVSKWKSQDLEAAEKWLNGAWAEGQSIPRILSAKGDQGDQ